MQGSGRESMGFQSEGGGLHPAPAPRAVPRAVPEPDKSPFPLQSLRSLSPSRPRPPCNRSRFRLRFPGALVPKSGSVKAAPQRLGGLGHSALYSDGGALARVDAEAPARPP